MIEILCLSLTEFAVGCAGFLRRHCAVAGAEGTQDVRLARSSPSAAPILHNVPSNPTGRALNVPYVDAVRRERVVLCCRCSGMQAARMPGSVARPVAGAVPALFSSYKHLPRQLADDIVPAHCSALRRRETSRRKRAIAQGSGKTIWATAAWCWRPCSSGATR